jgi:hypothetical protein
MQHAVEESRLAAESKFLAEGTGHEQIMGGGPARGDSGSMEVGCRTGGSNGCD